VNACSSKPAASRKSLVSKDLRHSRKGVDMADEYGRMDSVQKRVDVQ